MWSTAPAPTRPYRPAGRGKPDLRPLARQRRTERRLGQRLAAGLTPAQAARAERVEPAEVEALLAEPDFAALVADYRALLAQPEPEARARLLTLARFLLMEAMNEGDLRAAMFVLREEERGRDPARTLADGVIAAFRRAATGATSPSPTRARASQPSAPRPPDHPVDRAGWRAAARLRETLVAEHATVRRATATPEPVGVLPTPDAQATAPAATPIPTAVAAPAAPKRLNRHQRRRVAALRRQGREPTGKPAGRPEPRGQGSP
jgi:hypothetical protein